MTGPALVGYVLAPVASVLALFACLLGLRWVYGAQERAFDRRVARDLLEDWELQLELLAPDEAVLARLDPPDNIRKALQVQ